MAVVIEKPIEEVQDVPVMDNPLDVVTTEQAGDVVDEKVLQKAMDCEQAILRLKRQTVINFVEIGKQLKEVRDNQYYKLLGYDDFLQWCESPEIDFARSTAYRYIDIVEKLLDTGIYSLEEIEDKSLYKLAAIAGHVTSEDRLDNLLDLRRNDFEEELANVIQIRKGLPAPSGEGQSETDASKDAPQDTTGEVKGKPTSQAAPANEEFKNAEDVDYEEVTKEPVDEDESIVPFNIDEFGLRGKFRLVPVKEDVPDDFIDFPDVKVKATVYVKQTADGKEFIMEF